MRFADSISFGIACKGQLVGLLTTENDLITYYQLIEGMLLRSFYRLITIFDNG